MVNTHEPAKINIQSGKPMSLIAKSFHTLFSIKADYHFEIY
jgi:hypothetical protein